MNGRELMMHGGREQIDFRALILRFSNQSLTIWGSLINDPIHAMGSRSSLIHIDQDMHIQFDQYIPLELASFHEWIELYDYPLKMPR